jgi:hypothetical protein
MEPSSTDRPAQTCEVCRARVPELRRGRCWGCYSRWAESRPVGLGAACTMCGDRRRRHLRRVELLSAWMPICHNCLAVTLSLSPMPETLDQIRQCLLRDRRFRDRRRGKSDTRVFPRERRGLERRSVGHAHEGDLLLVSEDEIIIETHDEETRIRGPEPTS